MVLETTSKICELNRGDWPGDAAVLIRMQLVFTRIHQNAVAVYVALVVDWFVWLSAVVERDRVDPHILFSLAYLLPVVLPVHAVPVKIVVNAVFETSPDGAARISGRSVNDNGARSRTAAVIDPVLASVFTFLVCASDVVAERTGVPNVDRAIEFLDVVLRYKRRQRFAWARIGMNVGGEPADVVVFRPAGFVRQVKKSDRIRQLLLKKQHPAIGFAPRIGTFIETFSRAVKGARNNPVADTQTRPFITVCLSEIAAVEPAQRRGCGVDVVFVDQLDALAMSKAVVLRIEIATLIEFGLQTLVIDHCVHAVLIRQGEIKQLELDRYRLLLAISSYGYRS